MITVMMKMRTALMRTCAVAALLMSLNTTTNAAVKHSKKTHKSKHSATEYVSSKFSEFSSFVQDKYAKMLGVVPEAITNLSLYSFIDKWYGTKYRWGGTTKKGIDCSALMQKMYNAVFNTDIVRTSILQFAMVQPVQEKEKLQEGDLVFFKTRGNFISHVGMYLKNNHFVHSCSSKGVTISSLDNSYWASVYAGAGKMPRG
jgi:cell wall-associated NlpC family hydrolase